MAEEKTVLTPCGSCDRDTFHKILFTKDETEHEYHIEISYQVVECCGCRNRSFRKVVFDFESVYQISDDEWEVPQDITIYPGILKGHRSLPDINEAPDVVSKIYRQSLNAIKDGATILAGIGLRATIEAICNTEGISGRTLENRIDNLAKKGLVSQKDAERLHAIRFMGNDAAHEIQSNDQRSLIIALRIVEHLIVNLYILDQAANGVLDTIIKTYDEFIKLLNKKLEELNVGNELPLIKILGKDVRRFHGYLKSHETALISSIASGTYNKLSIGKVDSLSGSKEKFQHFVIV